MTLPEDSRFPSGKSPKSGLAALNQGFRYAWLPRAMATGASPRSTLVTIVLHSYGQDRNLILYAGKTNIPMGGGQKGILKGDAICRRTFCVL